MTEMYLWVGIIVLAIATIVLGIAWLRSWDNSIGLEERLTTITIEYDDLRRTHRKLVNADLYVNDSRLKESLIEVMPKNYVSEHKGGKIAKISLSEPQKQAIAATLTEQVKFLLNDRAVFSIN